jgi:2-haloacid dehalogenase
MSVIIPKAFLFDVFGTVVDWRSCVARELQTVLQPRGLKLSWSTLADDWRARYEPAMEEIRSGGRGFVPLDVLHLENLKRLMDHVPELSELQNGPAALGDAALAELNRCWHRLEPWPDSRPGLDSLSTLGIVAAHSNGNIALMVDLARFGQLRWDVILGAEVVGCYKPEPQSYLKACDLLCLEPHEVMMVAAHDGDLEAAQAQGLRTGYLHRPLEFGESGDTGPASDPRWEVSVTGIDELASHFRECEQ